MLSPVSIRLLLDHLDAIDSHVASRLTRKRPWQEPALTQLLCDLFDEDTQDDEGLLYSTHALNTDLAAADEPLTVTLRVETHQYPTSYERWVAQADLGMIMTHTDHYSGERWERGWLMQAKRLYPDAPNPVAYSAGSTLGAVDAAQLERIGRLQERVGVDFVRYLLYCPRPSDLDERTRGELTHWRSEAVATDIFDYALGLALRDDMLSGAPTVAAGLFLTPPDALPHALRDIHGRLFRGATPLSWFVLQHFVDGRTLSWDLRSYGDRDLDPSGGNLDHPVVNAIVRGDAKEIDEGLLADLGADDRTFTVLPAHTLTIGIEVGAEGDEVEQPRQLAGPTSGGPGVAPGHGVSARGGGSAPRGRR